LRLAHKPEGLRCHAASKRAHALDAVAEHLELVQALGWVRDALVAQLAKADWSISLPQRGD
jgi:hypothetical protein